MVDPLWVGVLGFHKRGFDFCEFAVMWKFMDVLDQCSGPFICVNKDKRFRQKINLLV